MPESFNVHQLKKWERCQKQYEFEYVRRLGWPSNPKNFRLGKGVHQLLDYEARKILIQPILDSADRDIIEVWSIINGSPWVKYPIIASEWGFSLEVAGNWIYGRIDRIVSNGDIINVLDWKTGTGMPVLPEEDWQTLIYLYAVYESQNSLQLQILPEQLAFTYVQVKQHRLYEKQIKYTKTLHNNTKERLTKLFQSIGNTNTYLLPEACPDRFCPYLSICGIASKPDAKDFTSVEC